jgi:glutathione peroxidase
MGAAESVPQTSIHEFTVKVCRRRSPFGSGNQKFSLCDPFVLAADSIFYPLEQDCNGKEVSLETYKGKVLLVVNVASKWYINSS